MSLSHLVPLLLLAPCAPDAATPRHEVSLNGVWMYQLADELDEPPVGGDWSVCAVPGYLQGHDYRRAWLRRTFEAPASMRGRRIKLRLEGVKYNSRVFLNGRRVGGHFGGYEPVEIDVTGAVRFDGPNELVVGCHDWTGVFTPGRVDFSQAAGWHQVRHLPRDKILAPIGGLYGLYGVWGDVTLAAHPAVHVKDLFIRPSVRRGELAVEYTLANESAEDVEVEIRAAVEDARDGVLADVLGLGPGKAEVPAGKTVRVTLHQPWPEPHLWSHVDPYLYHLRTELSTGDRVRTRFGFREFWVEGHRFVLNGTPVNLLATSWWPPHAPMEREEIEKRWKAIKRAGCVAFRTHTQPWRSVHYDVADELGLLMIVEGAVWNDDEVYRIEDPAFWDHYAAHLKAMIDRDKNHPSVVMWSLENEFYGSRLNDESPAKKDLVRMGRLVKQWDPTRPILYESDGDPGGVADVIGLHYPHEYPQYTCWPNEAHWLAEPQEIAHRYFSNGQKVFRWDRKKPLYVGEFLWIPSRDPSWNTVFFGDEAYDDYRKYRNRAKAESWRMQILGYRHHEVAGISPWTVIEGGPLDEINPLYRAHQYAYQPVAAYCLDYDRRFFSGENVTRRLDLFNDVMDRSELAVKWRLVRAGAGGIVDQGRASLVLGPAEHRVLEVALRMPRVEQKTDLVWKVLVEREGQRAFAEEHAFAAYPRLDLSRIDTSRIGLYDPVGRTRKALAAAGLEPRAVEALTRIPEPVRVLLVGAEAFKPTKQDRPVIGRVLPERRALLGFAGRGGRALVLEQQGYPEGLFDLRLTDHQSTMTFAPDARHPALRYVDAGGLNFWRGDHLVSLREPVRPAQGRPIVVSGSKQGLEHAPLVERPARGGLLVHSQLRLIDKLDREPAAGRILLGLLEYLAEREPASHRTVLLNGPRAFGDYLRGLGLRFDDLAGGRGFDLSGCRLAVCHGEVPRSDELKSFVENGGTLLVHRAPPDEVARVSDALGLDLRLGTYSGSVSRAAGGEERDLVRAVLREDLYWLGPHVGSHHAATPRAKDMADGIFTKTLQGKEAATYEIEEWQLEGQIVQAREPGVAFATSGKASAEIGFPTSGVHVIGILARGTPCQGTYPLVRVEVDGEPFGSIGVESGAWHTATCFGRVEEGRHKVSVAFANDQSAPPREDRNLYVDKVLVARDPNESETAFLTSPPAVAAVRVGRGRIVFDQVRWDTEDANAGKAARYAGSLLGALGGDFTPRCGIAIECETMAPQPGMGHFSNQGTHVSLACTGYVSTPVRIAQAGRYEMELVAAGTKAADEYPIVAVRLDGEAIGQVRLSAGGRRPYWLEVELPAGEHELALAFTNDLNQDGEDRNLLLDRAVFYRD